MNLNDFKVKCRREGEIFENMFKQHCAKINWSYLTDSSDYEDAMEHWDIMVWDNNNKVIYKVDIKGSKKSINDGLVVIELRNVRGNDGWIYGKADFIAFHNKSEWVIVNRKDVINLTKSLLKNEWVGDFKDCLYKKYSRKGNNDLMTKIKMSDLKKIETYNIQI